MSSAVSWFALSSMDWAAASDTAWIYGIAVGWDGPAMSTLARQHGWSADKVARLRKLRRYYRAAERKEEQ